MDLWTLGLIVPGEAITFGTAKLNDRWWISLWVDGGFSDQLVNRWVNYFLFP
jgi:hypothetical protein